MQILSVHPCVAVAVLAEVFDHEPDIFKMPYLRRRMPEPKTLGIFLDQRCGFGGHLLRRRHLSAGLKVFGPDDAHTLRIPPKA